jgi:3-phenylpropionate/trans-cinnamate dioxygenase ferredoxin subunit
MTDSSEATWHVAAKESDLTEDQPLSVTLGGARIGLFRLDGAIHAIEDVCPHAFALLSEGFVDGRTVECPLHEALFDIPTGKCLREIGQRDLKTYEVRTDGGNILVRA